MSTSETIQNDSNLEVRQYLVCLLVNHSEQVLGPHLGSTPLRVKLDGVTNEGPTATLSHVTRC